MDEEERRRRAIAALHEGRRASECQRCDGGQHLVKTVSDVMAEAN